MRRKRPLSLLLLLTACASGAGLRPSAAASAGYERCQAADYDPALSASERGACWEQWLERHADFADHGQPQYARDRLAALEAGEAARLLPAATVRERPEVEHEVYIAPPAEYRETACTPACNEHWDDCLRRCEPRDTLCRTACEQHYAVCNAGCP